MPGLLEEIADARGPNPYKHLDKLRAADREKRYPSLTSNRTGKQRLAGAGRPNQQHAFGNSGAQSPVLLGISEEVHDLLQFFLRFVHPRYVIKSHLGVLLHVNLGFAFAYRHHAAGGMHTTHGEGPDTKEHANPQHHGKHVA